MVSFLKMAHSLGLSALVEAHDEEEARGYGKAGARIIGVNNRNLKDFTVDVKNNSASAGADSTRGTYGVRKAASEVVEWTCAVFIQKMERDAVLIGETLMSSADKAAMSAGVEEGPP